MAGVCMLLKRSSQYDADLGIMSRALVSGINDHSGRSFTIQHNIQQ